jgi:hypothetical protein
MTACLGDRTLRAMGRTFLLASALKPETAARAAAEAAYPPDLVVRSPSALAREAAAIAVGGRWVFTVDEPLLASRAPGESGGDVLGRLARVLRGLQALDGQAPLAVCDRLDILGAGLFALDEEDLMRCADDLDQLRLLP